MRLLCLHVSRFSYVLDHPTPVADTGQAGEGAEWADALVAFAAFEPGDLLKVNAAAKELRKLAKGVGAQRIVLNPFAHLSSTLATPEEAVAVGRGLEDRLRATFDGETTYAGFGWYKSFSISVHGHESSQILREF